MASIASLLKKSNTSQSQTTAKKKNDILDLSDNAPILDSAGKINLTTFFEHLYRGTSKGREAVAGRESANAAQAAATQAAETDAANKRYQASMVNMQVEAQNLNTANRDLSTDTASNIVPGGTADSVSTDAKRRKKNTGAGIAASLGINV